MPTQQTSQIYKCKTLTLKCKQAPKIGFVIKVQSWADFLLAWLIIVHYCAVCVKIRYLRGHIISFRLIHVPNSLSCACLISINDILMDYLNISDARPMQLQSFGMDELLPVSNSGFLPVRWKRNNGLKCNLHAVMIVSCV